MIKAKVWVGAHQLPRATKRSAKADEQEEAKSLFLTALAESAHVGNSCRAAGITRSKYYRWRKSDDEFNDHCARALNEGVSVLEDEAVRRAVSGTLRPIYQRGRKVGEVREYSDILLIFMLKAHKPELYRDNYKKPDDDSAAMSQAEQEALRRQLNERLDALAGSVEG